jgi:exonuclease III
VAHWVYGPHQDNLKSSFLHELREIRDICVGPWIIGGDLNLIFKEEDKNNSNINRAILGNLHGLINSLDLKEVPLKGRRYTWSNQRNDPTLVKLDHVFCTSSWEDLFPDAFLHSNATTSSDHCPFTLKVRDSCMRKKRFHFESFWPKLPGFLEVVGASWNLPVRSSCPLNGCH